MDFLPKVDLRTVLAREDMTSTLLSFNNLVEANIVRALRMAKGIKLSTIREAIQVAAAELDDARPFLRIDKLQRVLIE